MFSDAPQGRALRAPRAVSNSVDPPYAQRPPRWYALAMRTMWVIAVAIVATVVTPCRAADDAPPSLAARARAALDPYVKPLPDRIGDKPAAPALVDLGRTLYFDDRLSADRDLSCNACHALSRYGVPTISGRRRVAAVRKLPRKIPSVYNAAIQYAQYWDSRVDTIEHQAAAALLNPLEMAMPSEAAVLERVNAVPGYRTLFAAAFPDDKDPVTFDHLTAALAAFERGLVTPAPFDRFLKGDDTALTDKQLEGLIRFQSAGCSSCHTGPSIGGQMLQKVGVVHPWPNPRDEGRFAVTRAAADRMMFKVASLRNVERTWPYFHDSSALTLDEAVRKMAWYELGQTPSDEDLALIVDFLRSLTGKANAEYIEEPTLPK
ncbi:MAG: cytochrome-c peroxidase [Phycisphaera sp.]|nr:cytochrome-c peroxidase [Phycisphaera sp.]